MKIAHIINPVKVPENHPSYLYYAQPITFMSIIKAKEYAESHVKDLTIELFTTQYEEDREIIPSDFKILSNLEKNVHDYFDLKNKNKKLPLLRDIIQKLYDNSDADYFVYSNADITLMPNFYEYVVGRINNGCTSLCIHRCDIPKYKSGEVKFDATTEDYALMCKASGTHTFGHDCFVFPRSCVPKLTLSNVFVGFPPVGTVMKNQLKRHCSGFREVHSKERMTFHLGADKAWSKKTEYHEANNKTAGKLQWG